MLKTLTFLAQTPEGPEVLFVLHIAGFNLLQFCQGDL